jgi:arsenate reductase
MSGRLKVIDLLEADRRGVLFLCVANSARSQMAEGFAKFLSPPSIAIFSAGSAPTSVHPLAEKVMKEIGMDISKQVSKGLEDIDLSQIAVAVTLCAEEECPVLPPDVKHLPMPLPDPAAVTGDEFEQLDAFRSSRNQVRELVSTLF